MNRKSKVLNSLSGLSRASPDLLDLLSVDHRFFDDRSLAIVTGADVEKTLEERIIKGMVDLSPEERRVLFEADGAPIGTFSAKIKIAHAFGIFGRRTRSDLELVRKLRNVFAHARKPISFTTPAVADACQRLEAPNRFPEQMKVVGGYDATRMRDRFLATCNFIRLSLMFKDDAELRDFSPHPFD